MQGTLKGGDSYFASKEFQQHPIKCRSEDFKDSDGNNNLWVLRKEKGGQNGTFIKEFG
jgi:hypothetical protein